MKGPDLTVKLKAGGTTWHVRPECADYFVSAVIGNVRRLPLDGPSVVKRNDVRALIRFDGGGECPPFILKIYRRRGWMQKVRETILTPAAERENRNLLLLAGTGIQTSTPIAYGMERAGPLIVRSFLATAQIVGARALKELLTDSNGRLMRDEILRHAALMTRSLEEAGLEHRDFHLGNMILDGRGSPYLMDLQRARGRPRASAKRPGRNLLQMAYSAYVVLNAEGVESYLDQYARCAGLGDDARRAIREETWRTIRSYYRRHMASRTQRCLKNSSQFAVTLLAGGRIYRARDVELDVKELLDRHAASVEAGFVLKRGEKTVLTRVNVLNRSRAVVVKQHTPSFASAAWGWLRGGRLRREWVGANGLFVRGVPVARPLVLVEEGRWGFCKRAYLICEYLDGYAPLNEVVEGLCGSRPPRGHRPLRELLRELAAFLARLHRDEIYHHDLKANNVMVCRTCEGGCRFALLDLDRVTFGRELNPDRVKENLAHLNAAIGEFLPDADRLRFLKYYCESLGRERLAKADLMEIIARSIRRRHLWKPQA